GRGHRPGAHRRRGHRRRAQAPCVGAAPGPHIPRRRRLRRRADRAGRHRPPRPRVLCARAGHDRIRDRAAVGARPPRSPWGRGRQGRRAHDDPRRRLLRPHRPTAVRSRGRRPGRPATRHRLRRPHLRSPAMTSLVSLAPTTDLDVTSSPLRDAVQMSVRSLRHTVRNTEALLMSVMLPVILLLLFVYVFGGALRTDGAYVDYVVPGLIVLCTGYAASMTAV